MKLADPPIPATEVFRGTYREDRSYEWNYEHGPVFDGPWPAVPRTKPKRFLGLPVNSRLGIPAGLLLNSRWIEAYARLGYDLLTYKTVRSSARRCYPKPNWLYVPEAGGVEQPGRTMRAVGTRNADAARVTATVSFGMPSKAPDVWMEDVARARAALGPRQVLIVSVVATPAEGGNERELVADFADLTAMAREAGAHVVEANLSCPNVCTAEGEIFHDARLSGKVARAMRQAAGRVPVLLKIGYLPEKRPLASLLRAVSGQASGVVMVNGVARPVLDRAGRAAFGDGRKVAGILGRGIHELCVASVREAVAIRDKQLLDLDIIGVGGVAAVDDAARFFDVGAAAVMMGSAPMYDPTLAVRMKAAHPDW
jgi:dihydroorotate dehydrogenase (NAD+) catalytic subunit